MSDAKAKLAAVLTERAGYDPDEPFEAAWLAELMELRGTDGNLVEPLAPCSAVFGVSARRAYLLSPQGLLTFNLIDVVSVYSSRRGLDLTVITEADTKLWASLAMQDPVAIGEQLLEMRDRLRRPAVEISEVATQAYRPPSKTRLRERSR